MSSQDKSKLNMRNKKLLIILTFSSVILLLFIIILGATSLYRINKAKKDLSANAAVSSTEDIDDTLISSMSSDEPSSTSTPTMTFASEPTMTPASEPVMSPTPEPTIAPTPEPTITPTPEPTPSLGPTPTPNAIPTSLATPAPTKAPTPTPKPKKKMPKLLSNPKGKRDEEGRLLQFKDLLEANSDVKGWIKDSTMDYVVLQSPKSDPEYYLFKDFFGDYYKAGSLFLDHRSSVETPTKNFVIHGHNMISTPEKMFHYLKFYKDVSYYKKHPIISFDTIYEEAEYKVFAIIKTTPKVHEDYFFEYRQSTFADASDFLNFVYQIRIRSLIIVDDVDINENDSLLTLSTCSYEVDNDYRTVVFARKIREGEDSKVNMSTVRINKNPLYCDDYYKQNGGKAPKLPATFEKALEKGLINWYNPPE